MSQLDLFADREQRWNQQRTRFVTPPVLFAPGVHAVEVIPEALAKPFVCAHHYSGSFPAARLSVGLFRHAPFHAPELVGVAVFGVPMQAAALTRWLGVDGQGGCELSRLVILDEDCHGVEIGFNAESWFVSRAQKLLAQHKPGLRAVLSYCDPVPRHDERTGEIIKVGHVGTIYKSLNYRLMGRSSARTHWLAPDGRVVSERALSKIRKDESGSDYAQRQLRTYGAPPRQAGEGGDAYVRRALESGVFRRVRHPGNLVFGRAIGPARQRTAEGFAPAVQWAA